MLVNNELFLISRSDIPKVPIEFSEESKAWWTEQKKFCIEGFSVGGKWMPPQLYFYINFWNIELNKGKSKNKIISRPWLRDTEWEVFYHYIAARGLSEIGDKEISESQKDVVYKLKHNSYSGLPIYGNEALDLFIMTARETGKELADYEKVITRDGLVNICDINVGDEVSSIDGYCKVTGKYPQGVKDIYRFTFGDGRVVDCGIDHLWSVYDNSYDKITVLSTKELLSKGLKTSSNRFRWRVPSNDAVEFETKELPIDPYILGALLGDGALTSSTPRISTIDSEIYDKFVSLLTDYELHRDYSTCNYNIVYKGDDKYNSEHKYGCNPLYRSIKDLGLNVCCNDKFIPDIYKHANIEQRFELVRGLLDTDGSINSEGSIEFINKSKKLVDGLAYVLRSLGINCQIGLDNRTGRVYNSKLRNKKYVHGVYYRLYIKTDKPVFMLSRKLSKIQKRKRSNKIRIINIEKLDVKNSCTCITVDREDGLFLTTNFVVTHNSFMSSALIGHEWLFNSAKKYIPPKDPLFERTKANITVGAGDSKYSAKLLSKVKLGFDQIARDGIMFAGKFYPHPFFQQYGGSFNAGKQVVAKYKKKVGGTWTEDGSMSAINHVSYKDNDYANQGSRNSLIVKEEVGMFGNLEGTYNADVETMMNGTIKYGTCVYIGTGGDMEGGTLDAYKMFNAPNTYSILPCDDIWESKGDIGLFVPATMRPNEFKDDNGNTKFDVANAHFVKIREELKNSKNSSNTLSAHIQYNPLVPSEAFLRTSHNIFPLGEIKEWLAELETKQIYRDAETVCELIFGEDGEVKPNLVKNLYPIYDFPLDKDKDTSGAVVIYHHPMDDEGKIPYGRYIMGVDPYDADKSTTSSLGSAIVIDRLSNRIVAEYSARPRFADMFYENCRRLALYYNAAVLYENEKMGVKQYFDKKKSLHLLMAQPAYIKDVIPNSTVERTFGMHMNVALKDHGEILVRDWLQEEYEPGKLNLRKIRCIPLLKELVLYDPDNGNYDRCLVKDSIITTDNGFKKIQDINVGDMVLTHTGRYQRVINKMQNKSDGKILKFKIRGDYEELIVTDNHPILCASVKTTKHNTRIKAFNNIQYLRADELNNKYQFVLHPKRVGLQESIYEDDMLYLMGWYASDGNTGKNNNLISICLQRNQEDIADKLMKIIDKYTLSESNNDCKKTVKEGYIKITKTSKTLHKLFVSNCGGANNKKLDDKFYNSSNLLPFVIGYLEGDGHQKSNANYDGYRREAIECASIYESLVKQVRQILIDNDIWCSMVKKHHKTSINTQYSIQIPRKYINKIAEGSLKFHCVDEININDRDDAILSDAGFWCNISTPKEAEYDGDVYNIEVENDNTYVVSNIVTHNCMSLVCCMYAMQELHKQKVITCQSENKKVDPFFTRRLFTKKL